MVSFKHGPRGVYISGKPFEIAGGIGLLPIKCCETFESVGIAAGGIVYRTTVAM
jgi:hypothetical protein